MSSSLRTALVGVGAALALLAGCGTEGYTPDCKDNVGANGVTPADDGCEQFGRCFGTYSGDLVAGDKSFKTQLPCTLSEVNEGLCASDNTVAAIQCCCATLTRVDNGELVEYAVKGTACINQKTMQPAPDGSLTECLYGFGEVDPNKSSGSGP